MYDKLKYEKMEGSTRAKAPVQSGRRCVLPLESVSLRERIDEMIGLAGTVMGRPADISGLRRLYAGDPVRIYRTLPDLLEDVLAGHTPIGLDD